jgi:hypothetical protein
MTSKKMSEMTKQEHKEIMKSALDFITKDFKVSEEKTEDLLKFAKGAMMFLVADLPISANGFIANTASEIIEELENRYDKAPRPDTFTSTIIHMHEVEDYLSMKCEDILHKASSGLYLNYLDDINKERIIEHLLSAYHKKANISDLFRINEVTVHSKLTGNNVEHAYITNGVFVVDVNEFATVMVNISRIKTVSIV